MILLSSTYLGELIYANMEGRSIMSELEKKLNTRWIAPERMQEIQKVTHLLDYVDKLQGMRHFPEYTDERI